MDTLRGNFDSGRGADEGTDWSSDTDAPAAEEVRELPPEAIGQDERRMQVRAYNHWASLLGDATFPSIEELEPENLPDFGPSSVLLDFSAGIDDPVVVFLGDKLAQECGAQGTIDRLSDVPPRSLLSRITDHYMQILANQAPIGFEAEFVNQRGISILYRGILLPFSSDDETIDFIYGVINWKEMADAATADELLLEIDQALDDGDEEPVEDEDQPHKHHADPVTEWADSPAHEGEGAGFEPAEAPVEAETEVDMGDNITPLASPYNDEPSSTDEDGLPLPDFGQYQLDEPEVDEFGEEIGEDEETDAGYSFASLTDYIEAPEKKAVDLDAAHFDPDDYSVEDPVDVSAAGFADEAPPILAAQNAEPVLEVELSPDAGLHDCLASARELAETARSSEDRSRQALYAAVGRAYDVSLAAQDEPEAFAQLMQDNGLTAQERAPMTPIVKLVFGQEYDKTRLTEYAAVLSHAHRVELERGSLADHLSGTEGGLKAIVTAERRLRREEAGKTVEAEGEVRAQLAKKLRELEELTLEALAGEGPEFSIALLRRDADGNVAVLGQIADDVKLVEKVGKKLAG